DEAGCQARAGTLDHLGVAAGAHGADLRNASFLDQEVARAVEIAGGIEQAGVAEEGAHGHHAGATFPRLRDSTSRQAMRTATPISTCSRMALRSMSSATSVSISTPRFIGPGCMMSA